MGQGEGSAKDEAVIWWFGRARAKNAAGYPGYPSPRLAARSHNDKSVNSSTLSLILAWSWLVIGVVATAAYAIVFPKILGADSATTPGLPESARLVMIVVTLIEVVSPGAP